MFQHILKLMASFLEEDLIQKKNSQKRIEEGGWAEAQIRLFSGGERERERERCSYQWLRPTAKPPHGGQKRHFPVEQTKPNQTKPKRVDTPGNRILSSPYHHLIFSLTISSPPHKTNKDRFG